MINLMNVCPFCGHSEHLEVVDSKEGVAKVVKCWACGATGPYGASNEELAMSFWNVRTETMVIKESVGSTANVIKC